MMRQLMEKRKGKRDEERRKSIIVSAMVRPKIEEFEFLQEKGLELSQRYAGRFVALVGREVAGQGATAQEAYAQAKRSYPESDPVLKYFPPTEAALVL